MTLCKLKDQNAILTGDLNLNLLNYNKKPETFFLEGIFTNNFLSQITFPIRVTKNSATLVDSMLINKEEANATWGNFTT